MPRINIQEKLFSDNRFLNLVAKTGDRMKAIGMVVSAFQVAQRFWIPEKKLIPLDIFLDEVGQDVIDCRLAEVRDGAVYVRGSDKNFQWYFDATIKCRAAGKASVISRLKKYGTAQPPGGKQRHADRTRIEQDVKQESNIIEASLSLSSSSSNTNNTNVDADASTHVDSSNNKQKEYSKEFEQIYQAYPRRSGDQGKARAYKKFDRRFTTKEKREQLTRAVNNYAEHCRARNIVGTEFVKMFSTFLESAWEEFLDCSAMKDEPFDIGKILEKKAKREQEYQEKIKNELNRV